MQYIIVYTTIQD